MEGKVRKFLLHGPKLQATATPTCVAIVLATRNCTAAKLKAAKIRSGPEAAIDTASKERHR